MLTINRQACTLESGDSPAPVWYLAVGDNTLEEVSWSNFMFVALVSSRIKTMRDKTVETLTAYSEGRISRNKALSELKVEFPDLLTQLSKHGLALPRVPVAMREEMADFVASLETGPRV